VHGRTTGEAPVIALEYLAHLTEKESEEGEDDEVGAAGKIRKLIHLEGGRDCKEDQLHSDRHDRAYGKVILVQNVNRHTSTRQFVPGQIISDPETPFIVCIGISRCQF